MSTTIRKGNITELQVQLVLLQKGYDVFTPVGDGNRIDLIVIINNRINRIQVKTSRKSASGFMFSTSSTAGGKRKRKYTPEEIDAFCTIFNEQLYMIPISKITGHEFTIRTSLNKNCNNQYPPNYAGNFLI